MDIPYLIVRRHGIMLVLMTLRFVFFLIPVWLLVWIFYSYSTIFSPDFSNYVILPIVLITINYIFIQLILNVIDFFGRVIIVSGTTVIIVHSTILLVDDIEFMNLQSILKVDVERHGFLSNILSYGHLTFELRNDIRKVHYVQYPHNVCQSINSRIPKKAHQDENTVN